ncbi:MAG: nickel pincer cofactor biosynthesis protein LarB [Deferribacterota bacterium]|nr:nickel pincer cofactor biosynthesis protein LarB [Deferribacterota bacterium]
MDLKNLLESYKNGNLTLDDLIGNIDTYFIERYKNIVIDTFREKRVGFPEVIYGRSKSIKQLIDISNVYKKKNINFICTGLTIYKIKKLKEVFPDFEYIEEAGIVRNIVQKIEKIDGSVAVITAGASDLKVALECSETLKSLGVNNTIYSDVGVAGIHRLFDVLKDVDRATLLVVIAGMEGALPSVVGGITYKPIIAVPTSVGYGAANNGFTPLFSMLTSCSSGITVVNIDNGFGAAIAAYRILNTLNKTQ